jgi:RHS repeat-associated protein
MGPGNQAGQGLYDVRARRWSPELGAFVSPDEFGLLRGDSTLWGWPGQNPLRYVDPSGRWGMDSSAADQWGAYAAGHPSEAAPAGIAMIGAVAMVGTAGAAAEVAAAVSAVSASTAAAASAAVSAEMAAAGATGAAVIGRYPAYTDLAKQLGANYFELPNEVYSELAEEGMAWAANQGFLEAVIRNQMEVIFASSITRADVGTDFLAEIQYLLANGYQLTSSHPETLQISV